MNELWTLILAASSFLLMVVLLLETFQYRRILHAARKLDEQDDEYRHLISDLGNVVNNNADILKSYAQSIEDNSNAIENLQVISSVHAELFKLIAISKNLEPLNPKNLGD